MEIVSREVQRYTPHGGNQYTTNKVTVEPYPTLRYISGSVPVLQRNKSISNLTDKRNKTKPNNVIGVFFSPTDAINDSIIRSIGNINLQNLIGDPSDVYNSKYVDL